MNSNTIGFLAFVINLFPFILYMGICVEFPRGRHDPWWLVVFKIWGAIFLLVFGQFLGEVLILSLWGCK